ncbi:hypothetical protein GCM10023065_31180 [Microbacterium laevaniformans]
MAIITTDSPASKAEPDVDAADGADDLAAQAPGSDHARDDDHRQAEHDHWLMPAMIDGSASGIWICRSTRAGDAPKA